MNEELLEMVKSLAAKVDIMEKKLASSENKMQGYRLEIDKLNKIASNINLVNLNSKVRL